MGNGSSAPPRRAIKAGGARARFEPPREMAPAEKGKMQAVAIMTSRRTRAQTLGKLIVRDPSILTNAPVDRDSYLLWCAHFPVEAVMRKSDEMLCSDPDLADAYHQLVRSTPSKLTEQEFWLRYYYAQIRVHEDEQMLEAASAISPKRAQESAASTVRPATAALCGHVQLSVEDRVSGVAKAEKDVIRFVERIERSEDNSGALLIEEEAMALSPPHQSTACGMITERTREAADSGISMFLREAEQEAERREAALLASSGLMSSDSDADFEMPSPDMAAQPTSKNVTPSLIPSLKLDEAQTVTFASGRELENEDLCDDDLDTSRSMYEL